MNAIEDLPYFILYYKIQCLPPHGQKWPSLTQIYNAFVLFALIFKYYLLIKRYLIDQIALVHQSYSLSQ